MFGDKNYKFISKWLNALNFTVYYNVVGCNKILQHCNFIFTDPKNSDAKELFIKNWFIAFA